jgi:hypothetical protein
MIIDLFFGSCTCVTVCVCVCAYVFELAQLFLIRFCLVTLVKPIQNTKSNSSKRQREDLESWCKGSIWILHWRTSGSLGVTPLHQDFFFLSPCCGDGSCSAAVGDVIRAALFLPFRYPSLRLRAKTLYFCARRRHEVKSPLHLITFSCS